MLIKTDKGCFISDCYATHGYDYNYHQSKIKELYFNGEQPYATYKGNWYYVKEYPEKIQTLVCGQRINERYELKNQELESEKLPLIIGYKDKDKYDNDVIDSLYSYKFDRASDYFKDVEYEIEEILDIENYTFPPQIEYKGIHKVNWNEETYKIKNCDVKHQLIDEIIYPEVMLHNRPCEFTSKQMYDITRQYILENIDNKVAKITSNYNFCFTVCKIIPLLEPETITYQNIFARTKRERSKVRTTIKKYEEKKIFEMTDVQERYKGYPVIPKVVANSETELKEKVDTWLAGLIEIINKPLCTCPTCSGNGYIDEIARVDFCE